MMLGQLIRQQREVLGLTWPELETRAKEAGYSVTKTYLQYIVKNEVTSVPEPKTIRAIAAAIGCSVKVVYDAAGESVGLLMTDQPADEHGRLIVGFLGELSEAEQAAALPAIQAQIQAIKAARQAATTGCRSRSTK